MPVLGKQSKKYIIYGLYSTRNKNFVKYIGFTCQSLNKRLVQHISEIKRDNNKKCNWIKKEIREGFSINIEILSECETHSEAILMEIEFIKMFKSFGAVLKNGTSGGEGVKDATFTKERRKAISDRISKKFFVFNYKTGELILEGNNLSKYCLDNKHSRTSIDNVIKGIKLSHKGMWFSKTNDFKPRERSNKEVWNKGIKTIGMQGFKSSPVMLKKDKDIFSFDTTKEAAIFLKCSHSAISQSIKRGTNKVYGYSIIKSC